MRGKHKEEEDQELLGKYTCQHGLTAWKNLAVQEHQAFIAIKLILLKLLLTIIKPLMILPYFIMFMKT